jgi:hypothetical protein
MIARPIVALAFLLLSTTAFAHKPSDSYLTLKIDKANISGHWDIALRDLDSVLDLDRNEDGMIDWGEVRTRRDEISAYALDHLNLTSAQQTCALGVSDLLIDKHSDGAYAVLDLRGNCATTINTLGVNYSLLFDVDAQHRGLLKLESTGISGANITSAVFPQSNPQQTFSAAGSSAMSQLGGYIADGVKHIAIGFDHILFLIALLLPAVLKRTGRSWLPVANLSTALWNVARIVTAFTIAHSITLSLATLQIVELPSRLVESLIALSVLATALDNLFPFLPRRRWLVAFVFGLLHGFGFASVLIDLNLPRASLALSLFGFNLGVEIGQLILVALLVPAAYLLRGRRAYSGFILKGGSAAIALLSLGWLIERSFNQRLMPF